MEGYESFGVLYRFAGRNDVGCYVSSFTGVAEVRVAPALSLERLLEGVTLPDGGSPLARGAKVEARAEAVPVGAGETLDAWKSVPVHVVVTLAGYRRLEYDVRLDERVEARAMERAGE